MAEGNGSPRERPRGCVYDFLIKSLGKAALYGVYDLLRNEGWVSVGIDYYILQFAVHSIRRWWNEMGQQRFPRAEASHSGWRRQQRESQPVVEGVAARVG